MSKHPRFVQKHHKQQHFEAAYKAQKEHLTNLKVELERQERLAQLVRGLEVSAQ